MSTEDLRNEITMLLEQRAYHERQIAFLNSQLPLMIMHMNERTLEEHIAEVIR